MNLVEELEKLEKRWQRQSCCCFAVQEAIAIVKKHHKGKVLVRRCDISHNPETHIPIPKKHLLTKEESSISTCVMPSNLDYIAKKIKALTLKEVTNEPIQ